MGILNVTPDSFFDGGKYAGEKSIIKRAGQMASEGAVIIDIGGYSSRPGAKHIGELIERDRVIPAIRWVAREFPELVISVDTFRSAIAKEAVECGAAMVNDISGGNLDKKMFSVIGELHVPYILMHIQGVPQTMQKNPVYKDIVKEIIAFFCEKTQQLNAMGVADIILDPGFGFGKTLEHNYTLLNRLDEFRVFDLPILAGISRKSMITKLLGVEPAQALNGTTALHFMALMKGVNILRVHDVKEAMEVVRITNFIKSQ